MNIQILSFPCGFKGNATLVEVLFGEKEVFSDDYCFKIYLKDSNTNLLDQTEVCMSRADYVALGETKEARIDAILTQKGITKAPDPELK